MNFLHLLQLLLSMYSLNSYMSRKKEKPKYITPDVSLDKRRLHSWEFENGCKCDFYYIKGEVADSIYCVLSSKNCSVEFDFNGNFRIDGLLKLDANRVFALMKVVNNFDMLNLCIKKFDTDKALKTCIEYIPSIVSGVSEFIDI